MIVGIDLGTSTSAIGYFSEVKGKPFGTVNLVQGGFGINWIPSAVLWDHVASTWHVGPTARHMRMGPGRAPYYVVSAKRHLGITPNIPLNGSTTVIEDGREIEVTPQLLLSRVLRNLKDRTEELSPDFHLDKVVVAIPMVYMSHEASLTREAVEMAGLELLDFIQEPTAAALCYVHDNVDMNTLREGERILVFDLGGGTFDITVFQLVEGDADELVLDVLATEGVRNLGGDDVDEVLVQFLQEQGMVLPATMPEAMRVALKDQVESAVKVPLSNAASATASTYFSFEQGPVNFQRDITFSEFRDVLARSAFAGQLRDACRRVAARVDRVDRVMMVGGSSQLPICREIIRDHFGDDVIINSTLNTQEAVVRGAVYRAAQLNGRPTGQRRVTLRNNGVLSHDFGVLAGEPGKERFQSLIAKGTPYPMTEPKALTFDLQGDAGTPLVIACAQGDATVPFTPDSPAYQVLHSADLGLFDPGMRITIRFEANHFGEILFSSQWAGGRTDPVPLRPRFGA
jgi:molecular chaperone DnaK